VSASGPARSEVAAAAAILAAFVALAAALLRLAPPDAAQLRAADPLLHALGPWGGRWLAVGVAAAVCATWIAIEMPARASLVHAARQALRGAVAAGVVLVAARLVFGATLPAAIPPEESARPGVALGLVAGAFEEAVFRLLILPVALQIAARRASGRTAVALACLGTGLLFALAHEAGGGDLDWRRFAVRALLPGAFFSALFLRPGPAFLVSAHAAAHLVIPFLFR
jgi:hypothetical protein